MNWTKLISTRLRALFTKGKLDLEMDEEMQSHIELRTQENIQAGMNAEEASLDSGPRLWHKNWKLRVQYHRKPRYHGRRGSHLRLG